MKHIAPKWFIRFAASLLIACVSPAVFADDEKKSDADKKEENEKTTPETTKDKEGTDAESRTEERSEKTGIKERKSHKERLAEALERAEEEKQRRREAWEAEENRRREAIKRVKEREAERKKKLAETPPAPKPQNVLPPEDLATITLDNGNSFRGVIVGETEEEITLKVEYGEMTFPKKLIVAIRRPNASPPRAPEQ